jgi:hypothetical protein
MTVFSWIVCYLLCPAAALFVCWFVVLACIATWDDMKNSPRSRFYYLSDESLLKSQELAKRIRAATGRSDKANDDARALVESVRFNAKTYHDLCRDIDACKAKTMNAKRLEGLRDSVQSALAEDHASLESLLLSVRNTDAARANQRRAARR